ncbi:MAG: flippase-like domain-containing protein [Chryseobacterium sp.]|uniref:lysylphosphatidylglycerol synthase transmembrane domain-containing protein n=1 Tax=Chryseobacterium sp. TaxID=1871047 RepID=UPI00281C1478|nr:lysylphosphatidylglycerol synthase transmembrane domain-containing protein [Chryseobacterium sp.]MDR2236318.1 flippase-like domain-containing protein [Chryseobacterium sp.]
MKKFRKTAVTLLKVGISLLLLYFVFRKVPFNDVWNLIKTSNYFFLILALGAFTASQIISSARLLLYFHAGKFFIHTTDNLKLYLIGMFYNFFIPGGIGGDAYKVYILNKKFGWNAKKLTKSVLTDRLSGLLAIVLLVEVLAFPMLPGYYKLLIVPAVAVTLGVAKIFFARFFPEFKGVFYRTLLYSLGVQALQLLSIYCILKSFTQIEDVWIYFMVFLISAVLSVISFSGIGVREWLFMKAAQYFTFDADVSVSTAMLFSFITAVVALIGICFQNFKYKTENNQSID